MSLLLHEIRRNPLLWLLVFVPVVLAVEKLRPGAHTLLFVLSVLAILFDWKTRSVMRPPSHN